MKWKNVILDSYSTLFFSILTLVVITGVGLSMTVVTLLLYALVGRNCDGCVFPLNLGLVQIDFGEHPLVVAHLNIEAMRKSGELAVIIERKRLG